VRKFYFLFSILIAISASGAEIKINFSDFSAGQTPTNFSSALAGTGAPGDWKIVSDDFPATLSQPLMPQVIMKPAFVKRGVLAQLSQDQTDEHFPMFIYDGATFKNFRVTTQFKIVSGVAEQMAGIVFRYQTFMSSAPARSGTMCAFTRSSTACAAISSGRT